MEEENVCVCVGVAQIDWQHSFALPSPPPRHPTSTVSVEALFYLFVCFTFLYSMIDDCTTTT